MIKYLTFLFFVSVWTSITQYVNYYASKYSLTSFSDIVKFTLLFSIPVLASNVFYMLYFWSWIKHFSYLTLSMSAFLVALTFWFIIQSIFLWKQVLLNEIFWIMIVFFWILVMNKEKIFELIKSI